MRLRNSPWVISTMPFSPNSSRFLISSRMSSTEAIFPPIRSIRCGKGDLFVRRLKAAPADKDARRAWRAVVNHHVVLRSSMRLFDGSWFQVIEREAMGQGELQTDSNKRRRTDEPIISAALATMEACKFGLEFPNWLLDNYGSGNNLIDEWESACGAEFSDRIHQAAVSELCAGSAFPTAQVTGPRRSGFGKLGSRDVRRFAGRRCSAVRMSLASGIQAAESLDSFVTWHPMNGSSSKF